ncbi:MAG TPA: hypothetical protein VFH99_04075 [Candidatus Saccharimonadales bacterium]|nr:hypothetical protein [Candidatus Saccharimonadales bacterium]
MLPDEPNEEEELEALPEDGETPFRPTPARGDDTYPSTDAEQDQTELYQQGIDVQEPNAGNTVEGYDPTKDHRLRG